MFSEAELRRYSRQILLPQIGVDGQSRLKNSAVLVVGVGGLGTPAALYLAAAGIGRIGLVDFDVVDETNLHRQILYGDSNVGEAKLEVARATLHRYNPHVEIECHQVRLAAENVADVLSGYDVVADGTDNFAARYLINDACLAAGIPNAFASITQFEGHASVFCTPDGPCYRCLFPSPPPDHLVPSCAEGGVLGVLPGLLGVIQATECLKLLLGIGEILQGRLLLVDALSMRFRDISVHQDPKCPSCGLDSPPSSNPLVHLRPISMPGQIDVIEKLPEITVSDYQALRSSAKPPFLLDVRQPEEHAAGHLGGTLIPLGDLPTRIGELRARRDDELLVVHCQMGGRSAQAVQYLRMNGFSNAVNLKGGLNEWLQQIGPADSDG